MSVANVFPVFNALHRVAIIGDVPSKDDLLTGKPFVGATGRFLSALLSRTGISRESCYLANIYRHGIDTKTVHWNDAAIQDNLYSIRQDLEKFKPNIVILMGGLAVKAAKDVSSIHPLVQKAMRFKPSAWRGTLFMCEDSASPFFGFKCITTYHPSYCLRDYETVPLLMFDLQKAARESRSPLLDLPKRKLEISYDENHICERLAEIRRNRKPVALDIEGGIDTMSCISFADAPDNAFIVPIYNKSGKYLATARIWRELALTLEDENLPKILQNALYDRFVLHYSYGIRMRNVVHDTMLKHWELYAELEKSLGLQVSIYTDEPYYKGDRKSQDDQQFYEYCCRDSAVTIEISNALDVKFKSPVHSNRNQDELKLINEHYALNVKLLNPFLYMELRGIRYDTEGSVLRRKKLLQTMHEVQAKLNALTGHGFSFKSINQIKTHAQSIFFTKKGDRPYKEHEQSVVRFSELLHDPNPSLATIGELENLCEVSLNVNSGKQFMAYLYETIKLPVQMSNVRGQESHPTADYEALLNLSRWCITNDHPFGYEVCQTAIILRALETRAQMLSISADSDGRIRCGYNVVGSNTGRISCYESPTGSGYNLQTIPNYTVEAEAPGGVLGDRDLFRADDDHWIFQCDLAGADGWTVAAYCAMLGDNTMLEHYRYGIKPYAAIALKLAGRQVNFKDKDDIKAAVKRWKMTELEKLCAKRTQHGGAYLEGGLTISRNILKDTEGKHYLSPKECDALKNWYLREMYPGIPKWHDWIARRLKERPILIAAGGQVRQFFGRPDEVLTKAVAFEPQANTTYATNLAAWKLWTDKDNRVSDGRLVKLRNEPLHQVHDALIGQFKKTDTDWAVPKIKSYFNNPMQIAGQTIVIPFEGTYGSYWGAKDGGVI